MTLVHCFDDSRWDILVLHCTGEFFPGLPLLWTYLQDAGYTVAVVSFQNWLPGHKIQGPLTSPAPGDLQVGCGVHVGHQASDGGILGYVEIPQGWRQEKDFHLGGLAGTWLGGIEDWAEWLTVATNEPEAQGVKSTGRFFQKTLQGELDVD